MKKMAFVTSLQIILLSFLFFTCLAQQTTAANLEEAKKAIAASNEIFFRAFVKGDSSLFIDRYAKDCWIMPPNAQALCGIGAPLEFFKTAYNKLGVRNGNFITIDVFGDGVEFVTEVGFWRLFGANNKPLDNGKFLVLWKKTTDGWKMFRDSFSSDQGK
jgi:ketosteroid isomerase-like protein